MTRGALRQPLPFGFHILVHAELSSFAVASSQAQKAHPQKISLDWDLWSREPKPTSSTSKLIVPGICQKNG